MKKPVTIKTVLTFMDSEETETIEKTLPQLLKMYPSHENNFIHGLVEVLQQTLQERDEARRELCELKSEQRILIAAPQEIADILRWDCYEKE